MKLIATLIMKPTNLSHVQSELQNDTRTIRIQFIVKKQHIFCAESFESDLNIYAFVSEECSNKIITQSGK